MVWDTHGILDLIDRSGYLAVGGLSLVESVFPPIAGPVLPLAGLVVAAGDSSLLGMIAAATVGSTIGSWILYAIAATVGMERTVSVLGRFGGRLGLNPARIERANDWFTRHGEAAVLICRCVPVVRSIVSIPAGLQRMNLLRFTLLTACGNLIWSAAIISIGYLVGDQVISAFERFKYLPAVSAVVVLLLFALRLSFRSRPTSDPDPSDSDL